MAPLTLFILFRQAEMHSLLSFIVVGGGPTSCEFVTELHDVSYIFLFLIYIYIYM